MTSRRPRQSAPPSSGGRGRRWLWALPLALVCAGLLLLVRGSAADAPEVQGDEPTDPAPAKGPRGGPGGRRDIASGAGDTSPASGDEVRQREVRLWERRLERAEATLESYRASTRYPHESRPIREHPDQVYPAQPERTQPLDKDDPGSQVRLRLKQQHVFLAGDQTVDLWVRCENAEGAPQPCEVTSALVHETEHQGGARALEPVPLAFTDAGGPVDAQAGDGTLSARLQPSRDGFAMVEGTLRVELQVKSRATQGRASFDVIYTGAHPAAFTGAVREGVEKGSLVLRLPVQVRKPGRYVVAARVDDAQGKPFAYLSFNEELQAGQQDVVLTVFGKLLRDEQPAFPLRLRDVEGFLLREMGDPDRELMAPLAGVVHTTRSYPLTAFSEAEWQSEERQRYLDAYTQDAKQARDHLEALAGSP